MIEFLLTFNNGEEQLKLPVPPQSFDIQTGSMNATVNINGLGEANLFGKRRLTSVSLSSYFPCEYDPLAQFKDYPEPKFYVRTIERWRDSGRPIRLLILGDKLNYNGPMAIETFTYSQKHGPEDIYYTLELKEYRFLHAAKPAPSAAASATSRPAEKTVPKTYTVKPKDTLWSIAKRLYGDDSKYTQLKQKNGIKDERKLAVGTVLTL